MNKHDGFYRAFEEKYRGTRNQISQRLSIYTEFVLPVIGAFPGVLSVDLGCGRGEWLELMNVWGAESLGVDLDEGMLSGCKDFGLSTVRADAIEYLKSLEHESLAILTGFHIAEHLEFDRLKELVRESIRVLKPGGLLILETPNPDNLQVASTNFYLDPSHNRPIPFQLLSFVTEYYGFGRSKVLFLQEEKSLLTKKYADFGDVLYGVSPDYAIVAQKSGHAALWAALERAFNENYGISKQVVVDRFNDTLRRIAERLDEACNGLGLTDRRVELSEKETAGLRKDLADIRQEMARIGNVIADANRQADRIGEKFEDLQRDVLRIGTELEDVHRQMRHLEIELDGAHHEISRMAKLLSPLIRLFSFFKKL